MTMRARVLVLIMGALALAGGLALRSTGGGGWGIIAIGTVVCASALLDRRYGRNRPPPGPEWQRTGEREVDHATGAMCEVWFDPLTGERRYVPLDHSTQRLEDH